MKPSAFSENGGTNLRNPLLAPSEAYRAHRSFLCGRIARPFAHDLTPARLAPNGWRESFIRTTRVFKQLGLENIGGCKIEAACI